MNIKKISVLFLMISTFSFSEIDIKIYKPIRFQEVNTNGIIDDYIVGEGTLEISTDTEEDFGKKLIFNFPETGLMTNRKRWLKIDKYTMEESEKEYVVQYKKKLIKFYAFVKKKNVLEMGLNTDIIEGEYVGYVPLIVGEYGKIIGEEETLKNK